MQRPDEMKTLPNYRLYLRFADGVAGEFDLAHLVGRGVFQLWNQPGAFEKAHLDEMGQIQWNDEVEICSDALYLQLTNAYGNDLKTQRHLRFFQEVWNGFCHDLAEISR